MSLTFCVYRRRKVALIGLLLFLEQYDKEKLTSQWNFSKWHSLAHSFLIFVIPNDSYYVGLFVPALFILVGNISALKRPALHSADSGFYLMIQYIGECLMGTYCVSGLSGKSPRLLLSGNIFLLLVLDFSEDQQLTECFLLQLD